MNARKSYAITNIKITNKKTNKKIGLGKLSHFVRLYSTVVHRKGETSPFLMILTLYVSANYSASNVVIRIDVSMTIL